MTFNKMFSLNVLVLTVYCLAGTCVNGQTKHCGSPVTALDAYKVQNFSAVIADAELKGYKMQTGQFGLPPGGVDTISHRHDCELFVIVLSGTAEIGQDFKAPVTVHTGEVFYEARNVVHSLTRNADKENSLNLLLVYIMKEGRQFYTRLYPEKK
jgi:quercetin dioxygenase-like cupin family protein